jgi:hypothetical protein
MVLRMRLSALALAALLAFNGGAEAFVSNNLNAAAGRSYHGPGSNGFLPTCSGQFNVTNHLQQSNAFGTSPWSASHSATGGASNPTVTSGQTAPDGSSTAFGINISQVNATNSFSVVNQLWGENVLFPYGYTMWVKNVSSNTVYVNVEGSHNSVSAYITAPIPPDSLWHQTYLQVPGGWLTSSNIYYTIGIDTRDTQQATTSSSSQVYVWHAQASDGYNTSIYNYVPTTTATVTQVQTINCPAGVAFRDFANLSIYGAGGSATATPGSTLTTPGPTATITVCGFPCFRNTWDGTRRRSGSMSLSGKITNR